jgi:hypothetical protein
LTRRTISFRDFLALRSGDLVVWRGKYLRTVAKGPADCGGLNIIQFAIRHRSWTSRIITTYLYTDVSRLIRASGKRGHGLMLPSEYATLEAAGFNVRRELRRELDQRTGEAKRMGRPLCRAYPRLAKLIRGKAARP